MEAHAMMIVDRFDLDTLIKINAVNLVKRDYCGLFMHWDTMLVL